MAVVVVAPDRDERDGRIDGVEEARFLVRRRVTTSATHPRTPVIEGVMW
jgi:hypothetical protein